VEAREEVKEWRANLLQTTETEARGRAGAKLEILSDCPNAGKEREAIAAIGKIEEGGLLLGSGLGFGLDGLMK